MWRNVAFDPGKFVNQAFFYEAWTALTDIQKRKVTKGLDARNLVNQHIKTYMEASELGERIKFNCAAAIGAYEAEKMQAAFVSNIKLRFGSMLRCAVNLLLGVKVGVAALRAEMEERGATDDEIKAACKELYWDPARQAKVALAARRPDLSDIPLRSWVALEPLLEAVHGSYPPDYPFDGDDLYYDVKSDPMQHFRAFFRLARVITEAGGKPVQCAPMRTSFIPSCVHIDERILKQQFKLKADKSLEGHEKTLALWAQLLDVDAPLFGKQGNKTFRG
ncbi:hypothetical protein IWQ57_004179, partial [Coemansia nantahalensis]